MRVVGIMGKAGAGKTTLAKGIKGKIQGSIGFHPSTDLIRIRAFADPLKEMVRIIAHLEYDQLYGDKKDAIDPRYGVTPRHIMQQFGTDFVRRVLGEDFWVKRMDIELKELNKKGTRLVIIDDVRSQLEADFIMREGLLIHIVRDNNPLTLGEEESKHDSEVLPDTPWAMVIRNDGTKEELTENFFTLRRILHADQNN